MFIIETNDYDSYVVGAVSAVEDAPEFLKRRYPSPYVVKWDEPTDNGREIAGHFEAVLGWSTAHIARFSIREIEVFDVNACAESRSLKS